MLNASIACVDTIQHSVKQNLPLSHSLGVAACCGGPVLLPRCLFVACGWETSATSRQVGCVVWRRWALGRRRGPMGLHCHLGVVAALFITDNCTAVIFLDRPHRFAGLFFRRCRAWVAGRFRIHYCFLTHCVRCMPTLHLLACVHSIAIHTARKQARDLLGFTRWRLLATLHTLTGKPRAQSQLGYLSQVAHGSCHEGPPSGSQGGLACVHFCM